MLPYTLSIDDAPTISDTPIHDRANITATPDFSLPAALQAANIASNLLSTSAISVTVNGRTIQQMVHNFILKHNGTLITDPTTIGSMYIAPGDYIEYMPVQPALTASVFVDIPPSGKELRVMINGEHFTFPGGTGKIFINGREATPDTLVNDGDILSTVPGRDAEAVMVDIFNYLSIDPHETMGKKLKLSVNQQDALFTTPLPDGADVNVHFE